MYAHPFESNSLASPKALMGIEWQADTCPFESKPVCSFHRCRIGSLPQDFKLGTLAYV